MRIAMSDTWHPEKHITYYPRPAHIKTRETPVIDLIIRVDNAEQAYHKLMSIMTPTGLARYGPDWFLCELKHIKEHAMDLIEEQERLHMIPLGDTAESVFHDIGGYFRRVRKARGWTQRALGSMIGKKQDYVAFFEHNHTAPTLTTIKRLADPLGIRVFIDTYDGILESDNADDDESDPDEDAKCTSRA